MPGKTSKPSGERLTVSLPIPLATAVKKLSNHFSVSQSTLIGALLNSYALWDLLDTLEWAEVHAQVGSAEWERGRHALTMFDHGSLPQRIRDITPAWEPKHVQDVNTGALGFTPEELEQLKAMAAERLRDRRPETQGGGA